MSLGLCASSTTGVGPVLLLLPLRGTESAYTCFGKARPAHDRSVSGAMVGSVSGTNMPPSGAYAESSTSSNASPDTPPRVDLYVTAIL